MVLLSFHSKSVIHWFLGLKVVSFKTSIDCLSSIVILLMSSLGTAPYDPMSQNFWIISVADSKLTLFNIQFSDYLFPLNNTQPNVVCNATGSLWFLDLVSIYKERFGWSALTNNSMFFTLIVQCFHFLQDQMEYHSDNQNFSLQTRPFLGMLKIFDHEVCMYLWLATFLGVFAMKWFWWNFVCHRSNIS